MNSDIDRNPYEAARIRSLANLVQLSGYDLAAHLIRNDIVGHGTVGSGIEFMSATEIGNFVRGLHEDGVRVLFIEEPSDWTEDPLQGEESAT